ncbi:MAG: tRNA (5-methylaminomethyl-2-thiouridine)(34)-methyltransferase MnmD [Gemmobacter sp.]
MTAQDQTADIAWRDGTVPVSTRFDDPYFSLAGGLAETRHVFLAGNDLPARMREAFHIAELGFGTGLNLLATALALADAGSTATLTYTAFEAYPMAAPDIARALDAFPETAPLSTTLVRQWQDGPVIDLPGITARVVIGDARDTLPRWPGRADAWYLDGFSPARNPQMWEPDLMAEVAAHTAPGGTFATYTAAGHVRRALQAAGFQVDRRPGFGTKRHMTVGRLPPHGTP